MKKGEGRKKHEEDRRTKDEGRSHHGIGRRNEEDRIKKYEG